MLRSKKKMLEALKSTLGIVTPACAKAGILSRQTHYSWMKNDPEYKKAVEDISEEQGDFVEGMFLKKIQQGDGYLIWKYLACRSRDKGYGEHHIVENIGEQPKQIINIFGKDIEF